jgi:hypothetical protein
MSNSEAIPDILETLRRESPDFSEENLAKIRFVMVGEEEDFTDPNEELRTKVIEYLYSGNVIDSDLLLLRFLMEEEKKYSSACEGTTQNIYLVATLIMLFGELSDVFIVWDAKYETFDLSFALSAEYLFIRGEGTQLIDYVKSSTHPDKNAIVEYLNSYVQNDVLEPWVVKAQATMREDFIQRKRA